MCVTVDLPLSEKQVESIRHATGRVNVWEGSIRAGKTLASLLAWLIWVADAPHGGELVVVARTRESAYRNIFSTLEDTTVFGDVSQHVHYTSGAPTAHVLGRTVHVFGASDAKAEKALRGMTVVGAYVDEITVLPADFFTQLLGRMSPPGARLFGTTNPDNPAHWLKRRFLDRIEELPDWRSFHFRMRDNPTNTAEFIAATEREFTGLWYRRFILGEWVAAEGAVYDMWDDNRHVIAWSDLPPMRRLLAVGVDFGTTNPSSGVLIGLGLDTDPYGQAVGARLYAVDEWRHDPAVVNRRMTNADQSAALREWLHADHLPYPTSLAPEWVFVDPAAASFSVQLQADGISNVRPADNTVSYGIGTVASLLSADRLLISDRCQGLIQEITGYSWDPAWTLRGEDKPIKVADHSLDAMRYAVTTTESVWRPILARYL